MKNFEEIIKQWKKESEENLFELDFYFGGRKAKKKRKGVAFHEKRGKRKISKMGK